MRDAATTTMPEGHTIHRLAQDLQPLVGSRVAASSPQGRFREGAEIIDGHELHSVQAHGKHLLLDFGAAVLHVHLGLAGAMFRSDPARLPRTGVRLRLVAGVPATAWDLAAPLKCELVAHAEAEALAARLGPDPLRGDDPTTAFERVRRSGRAIGDLVLDQSVVAGVGNVFRAEVLHRCGVHPSRAGSALSDGDLRCLWDTLTSLMNRAVSDGRIITVDTDATDRGSLPESEGRFVYKQERCRRCGHPVRMWTLARRTAYACEICQPVG